MRLQRRQPMEETKVRRSSSLDSESRKTGFKRAGWPKSGGSRRWGVVQGQQLITHICHSGIRDITSSDPKFTTD